MPKKVERKLKREALIKFPGNKEKQNAYVYGTMRHQLHWKPKRER